MQYQVMRHQYVCRATIEQSYDTHLHPPPTTVYTIKYEHTFAFFCFVVIILQAITQPKLFICRFGF